MILTIYTATTMIIIAYLLGSIPSAVWIGKKYYGIDIREHGSKNAGTTNMLRVLGRRAALPVFALDFLKGFVAVTIIELMQYDDLIGQNDLINLKIVAVFAAVLGHIFPIFAGFRGGKGVATLVGAVTGIYPPVALLCFGVWLVILMVSHYVSLASMVAGCCFPVFTLISPKVNGSTAFVVFSFVIAILLIYTHRKVHFFDQEDDYLGRYSFLMDAKTFLPVYAQKEGPKLYYYTKKNYLIYMEISKENDIEIVEFTEEDHQSLTMELLSKGRVKKNKVDSKGFKQIIL